MRTLLLLNLLALSAGAQPLIAGSTKLVGVEMVRQASSSDFVVVGTVIGPSAIGRRLTEKELRELDDLSKTLGGYLYTIRGGCVESGRRFDHRFAIGYNGRAMNSPFLDLLKQIASGVIIYEPFRRDAEGMVEFQDTVHRLREMERLGLVGQLFVQTRTSRDAEVVEMVMVQGGLTHEGQRLLDEQSGPL